VKWRRKKALFSEEKAYEPRRYELLQNDGIVTTAVPPALPKAGKVYLFKPDEDAKAGKLRIIVGIHVYEVL